MADNSVIYNLDESTSDMYQSCFALNGDAKNSKSINWQFFENGHKNFVNIEVDKQVDKVAAIYATFTVQFKINNNLYLGSQSLDTITDIDYRGKGLFIKLAKNVYQKAKEDGLALVYGFPNGNSIHGFKKKLDWEVLDPVPFLIKPLKSRYFTNKISFLKFLPNINLSFSSFKPKNGLDIVIESSFPADVDKIWDLFSQNIKVSVHRDKKYLDWRYINKPFENYKIAHCYSNEKEYLGYIIYTVKGKHGGKIAYIMELIYDLKKPEAGNQLLKFAVKEIKNEKADCILCWCMEHAPNASTFSNANFFKLPEKFRPIELHFGASSFNHELDATINNRKNWYLSYSDSDTV